MKTQNKKKLAFDTQTIRTLSADEMTNVNGGAITNITNSCSCNSCVCSIVGDCPINTGGR